ncbi:GDSL-type esterase/lipase family protein [Armatimonas sp.]|uniref:GDSL-type esterase/lipase family protein n=1 Tax=Armatimonas sp. TaxID=1872638 RepID=UPI00286ABB6A|nr:GDSL-type esterase/lipase family protein [Armatimonas sp.]
MKSVLCYGDSNTWGASPIDITRLDDQTRWTGVLQCLLGESWRVLEEGLSNRTTGFDDALVLMRNGKATFPMVCDTHRPFEWLIVMLGTNDAKSRFPHTPDEAADAVESIGKMGAAQGAKVLLIAPPPLRLPIAYPEFDEARAVSFSRALAPLYLEVAEARGWEFLNAGSVISVSLLDGVHVEAEAHTRLAQAIASLLRNA